MSDNFKYAQLQPYSLAGAGAVIGDTTITLKSMTDIDGNALSMSGTFGTIGFGTMEPGNGALEEQISFSGLTNNANGTVTLTGVKSVAFTSPYTQTTGLSKTHAGSTTFVISNTSGFYDYLTSKDDDETVNGLWTFTQNPQSSPAPVANSDLANKLYVDTHGGTATNYDQNIIAGIAGENLTGSNAVYLKTSDGKWYKTQATTSASCDGVILGIAQAAATTGNAVNVCIGGVDKTQTGLTPGATYYLSDTAGAISSSAGTISVVIGKCNTISTQLVLSQRFTQVPTAIEKASIPTSSEKSALAGNDVTIAVGSTNKYVTQTGLQNAAENYAISTGTASNYAITVSPTPTAYAAGQRFGFKAHLANTGSATVNVNGLGAKNILKLGGLSSLVANDIANNGITVVEYDGTSMQMLQPPAAEYKVNGYSTFSVSQSGTGNITGTIAVNQNERLLIMFTGYIAASSATTQNLSATITTDGGGMAATCAMQVSSGSSNAGMVYPASMSGYTAPLSAGTRTVTVAFTAGSSGGTMTGTVFIMKLTG